jgi:hypothetical protein
MSGGCGPSFLHNQRRTWYFFRRFRAGWRFSSTRPHAPFSTYEMGE